METVVQKLLRFQVGSSSVLIATLALLTTLVWVNPANAQATTTLKGGVEQNVNPDASEILPRALPAPELHKYLSSDGRLTLPATAQPSNTVFRTFGIEGMSCAYWLASPVQARDGRAWILGYWAANNRHECEKPSRGCPLQHRDDPRVGGRYLRNQRVDVFVRCDIADLRPVSKRRKMKPTVNAHSA
jgi:hypothetical protein